MFQVQADQQAILCILVLCVFLMYIASHLKNRLCLLCKLPIGHLIIKYSLGQVYIFTALLESEIHILGGALVLKVGRLFWPDRIW
jgi:hypothetical protein